MTAISDFVANPSQFLRNNLLRANFQLNPLDGEDVRMFKFVPHPYQGTSLSDGHRPQPLPSPQWGKAGLPAPTHLFNRTT